MKSQTFILIALLITLLTSCVEKNPNKVIQQEVLTENVVKLSDMNKVFEQKCYVPIYSDIYTESRESKILLTATLSIRNTSMVDTLFIKEVDYYNTSGDLVRHYIKEPIYLKPLESFDYVIDRNDDLGGSGANFVISWSARKEINPLFQAVMLGTIGQHAFAFTSYSAVISD